MSSPSVVTSFRIPSLDCGEELALIRTGLASLDGIVSLTPNYLSRSLSVEYQADRVTPSQISDRLAKIGFPAEEPADDGPQHTPGVSLPRVTTLAGIGLLVGAALVWFWQSDSPAVALLATLATVTAGLPVMKAAVRAVRLWRLDMNALMTIAAIGALATGQWFEGATAMCLFGLSLWLETYSLDRARRAVRTLVEFSPDLAHRVGSDDTISDVDPNEIAIGEHLLVRPGERFPVDGIVVAGESSVNESPITGEPMPVDKTPDAPIFAGTLNGESALRIQATRPASESTLAHIGRLVEQAHAARGPTERFVDRFAQVYTPIVIVAAILLAFVPPLLTASETQATWFFRGLVLLVIACPCALVISTPVTIVCGLHRAAQRGVLIKGGQFLETLAKTACVAVDKTGTLTQGKPQVSRVDSCGSLDTDEIVRIAAAIELHSEHPLGRAIVAEAAERAIEIPGATDTASLRGFGMSGKVSGNGYFVASPRYYIQEGILSENDATNLFGDDGAATIAVVGNSKEVLGVLFIEDPIRSDAAEAIRQLRQLGVERIAMLTGDRLAAAQRIGNTAGIDEVFADLLPEDKVVVTKQLADQHAPLVMVGDGVNDAPALAAAHVGVALGSGASDTALETADVVVMAPHLTRLPELIRLGRRTRGVLVQNIAFALTIKLVVLLLAATGIATMWMAVAADVGTSMLVIFNGMRLLSSRTES